MLDALRAAVREALERKRRLDQYAVVWRDDRPAFIGPNAPAMPEDRRTETTIPTAGGRKQDG